jgi:thiol-disulfide isomerase/thioredoxin
VILLVVVISMAVYLFADHHLKTNESFEDVKASSDADEKLSGAEVSGKAGGDPVDLTSMDPIRDMAATDLFYVLVYDTNCPHCVEFKPTWNEVANKYNGTKINSKTVHFYQAGEAQEGVRTSLSQKYNVQGFPTVLILRKDGDKVESTEYDGSRDFSFMSKYVETHS